MRVLISGTCRPELNSNYNLIEAIAAGFGQLEGIEVQLVQLGQLIATLDTWRPQITLLVGGLALESIPLVIVQHRCRQVDSRLVFWCLEDPYEIDHVLQQGHWFDLICTNDFASRCFYPGHWRVEHLPLAAPQSAEPSGQKRLNPPGRWMFCGVSFPNRLKWIRAIQAARPEGLLMGPGWPPFAAPTRVCNQRVEQPVLHQLYGVMPVTLYLGRSHNLANGAGVMASTPGPRLFEAAGCGGCQLVCGSGLEGQLYYEPKTELLWAETPDEAIEHLQWAEAHPEAINQIAHNAWRRTQAEHLYRHRAAQLMRWVNQ